MERNTKALFIAVPLVLALQYSATAQQPQLEPSATTDVYEAVVRYQVKTWSLAANVYCVSVKEAMLQKIFSNDSIRCL